MEKKSAQIAMARNNNYVASERVAGEWSKYGTITNSEERLGGGNASVMTATFTPLVLSHWNQNGGGSIPYNNL